MSYYQRHVFFCCNQRDAPEKCCNDSGATDLQKYAKERIKALGLDGPGKVRMNQCGLPRPLRGRTGAGRLSRGRLVHLRRPRRHRRDHRPPHRRRRDRRAAEDLTPRTTERLTIDGPAGALEVVLNRPPPRRAALRGIALVAHPHPLQGGTLDNKVAQTLAKTFFALGYASVRFNFRGVGASEGAFDDGVGETDDALAALAWAQRALRRRRCRVVLAGFSFGSLRADARREDGRLRAAWCWSGRPSAASRSTTFPPTRSSSTARRTTSCRSPTCFAWARPQELPVVVFPGCGHFFHGRLPQLQQRHHRHVARRAPGDARRVNRVPDGIGRRRDTRRPLPRPTRNPAMTVRRLAKPMPRSETRRRGRMGGARRPRRVLPARRALPHDRPHLHPHLGARARDARALPDQRLRPAVRRDHRVEPREGDAGGRRSSTTRPGSASTRRATSSTARSTARAGRRLRDAHAHRRRARGRRAEARAPAAVPARDALHRMPRATTTTRASRSTWTSSERLVARPRPTQRDDPAQPRAAHLRRDRARRVRSHVLPRARVPGAGRGDGRRRRARASRRRTSRRRSRASSRGRAAPRRTRSWAALLRMLDRTDPSYKRSVNA